MTYKNNPPILRNLDNFLPGAFYSTLPPPLQLGTKEYKPKEISWELTKKMIP